MRQYWNQINERERKMLMAGSAALAAWLFYILLYAPLFNALESKKNQLTEKTATLNWMKTISVAPASQHTLQNLSTSELLSLITQQLSTQAFSAYPYQLQQTGQGDIQLSFSQISYAQFLRWIWSLSQDYALTLKQITIEKSATPGLVSVLLILSLKNA